MINETGGGQALYALAPDGTGRVKLASSKGAIEWPAWSPDGSKISLLSRIPKAEPDLVVVDLKNGKARTMAKSLGGIQSPTQWSPDSTKIAFENGVDGIVIGANGSQRHRVTPTDKNQQGLRWARDSKRMFFSFGMLDDNAFDTNGQRVFRRLR